MNRTFERLAAPIFLLVACSREAPADSAWQIALDEVVAAERAFAMAATTETVQTAFLANMDETSILFRPGPVPGAAWTRGNPFPDDFGLEWAPAWADVSADGSLGVTTGPYRSGRRGTGTWGGHGQYMTVWRRTPAGFVVAMDWGILHEAPADSAKLVLAAEPVAATSSTDPDGPSLRMADEDLNTVLASAGAAAWTNYLAGNVRWLRDGAEPAFGPEAIPPLPAGASFTSLGASMAPAGDFGFAWGELRSMPDSASAPSGHYVRIWRKDPDGSWNIVVDGVGRG